MGKGDEIYIGGIEDDFNGEQDADQISSGEHPVDADAEENNR